MTGGPEDLRTFRVGDYALGAVADWMHRTVGAIEAGGLTGNRWRQARPAHENADARGSADFDEGIKSPLNDISLGDVRQRLRSTLGCSL